MRCLICQKSLLKVQVKRGNKCCSASCRYKQHSIDMIGRMVGENHPLFGKHRSEEEKEKISNSNKGKRNSIFTEFKKGNKKPVGAYSFNRGKNNPTWKGGTYGTERHKDMGRFEYKVWRKKVYERDDYTCIWCHKRGGRLNADHIKEWNAFPELRYELSNGRTLCKKCHDIRHSKKYMLGHIKIPDGNFI